MLNKRLLSIAACTVGLLSLTLWYALALAQTDPMAAPEGIPTEGMMTIEPPQNAATPQIAPSGAQQPVPAVQPGTTVKPGSVAPAPVQQPATPAITPGQSQPGAPSRIAPAQRRMPPSGRAAFSGGGAGSSFFFDDADIFEVVQTIFGDVLQLSYIIDPQVKGRVNFRTTTQIPREKILPIMEIILRLNGAAVVEESGLYRIIPIANIAKEPAPIRFGNDPNSIELKGSALIQIVPLMYINSSEMMSILQPLLTQGGAIYDLSRRNVLMIADTDANVRRLMQAIQMFDADNYRSAYQQKIYVYPLQNSKADHVSKILSSLLLGGSSGGSSASSGKSSSGVSSITGSRATGASQPTAGMPSATPVSAASAAVSSGDAVLSTGTKIYPDEVSNSLVIYASPGDYALILAAVKQLDSIPRQVMIEAVVASVELTDNLTLGVRWNVGNVRMTPFGKPVTGPLGFTNIADKFSSAGTTPPQTFAYTGFDPTGNVRLAIEALAENNKAKILSSPHILVADNREARIQVGQQIPIATQTTTTPIGTGVGVGTANTTSSSIQYKDTGTILKVKPQVNDSGLISLEITQEVSSAKTQSVLGTDQYVISKSEVATNLIAQDGQTIVIGGLVGETVDYGRSGIPFLSKIPILGYLFGQTHDNVIRQELVILLTPRVVRNQPDASKMTSDYFEMFKNLDKELNIGKIRKTSAAPAPSNNTAMPQVQQPKSSPATPPANGTTATQPQPSAPQKVEPQPMPANGTASPQTPAAEPQKTAPQLVPQQAPQIAPPVPNGASGTPPEVPGTPMMYHPDKQRAATAAKSDSLSPDALRSLALSDASTAHASAVPAQPAQQTVGGYHARICSFETKAPAEKLQKSVEKKLGEKNRVSLAKDGDYFIVKVHGFSSRNEAKAAMQKLRIKDYTVGKTESPNAPAALVKKPAQPASLDQAVHPAQLGSVRKIAFTPTDKSTVPAALKPRAEGVYHVRICSFETEAPAENLRNSVEKRLGESNKVSLTKDGDFFVVRVHGFTSIEEVKSTMRKLRIKDYKIGKTGA